MPYSYYDEVTNEKEFEATVKKIYENEPPRKSEPDPKNHNPEWGNYDLEQDSFRKYVLDNMDYYTWSNAGYQRKYNY